MKKNRYLTLFNYYKQQEIKKGGFYQSPHGGETFRNTVQAVRRSAVTLRHLRTAH